MMEKVSKHTDNQKSPTIFEVMFGKTIKDTKDYARTTASAFDDNNSKSKPYTKFGKFRYKW